MDTPSNIKADRQRNLAQNIAWNSLGSLVYLFCNWATTVLVAALASDFSDSGDLAIAMAVGNIFATIMLFRARTVQVADVDRSFSTQDFTGFRFLTFLIAAGFCFIYSSITVSADQYHLIAIYLLFKTGESLSDVYHGSLQLHERFDCIGKSSIARGLLLLLGFLLGFLFFKSLEAALVLMSAFTWPVVILYDRKNASSLEACNPLFCKKKMRALLLLCFPGFFAQLFCTIVISYPRQLFGFQFGADLLGIYAAIAAPTVIVQALASYMYVPLINPLAQAWSNGRIIDVLRMSLRFVLALTGAVIVCLICLKMFGTNIMVAVYGDEIEAHVDSMYPLIICTGVTALVYYLQDLMIVCKAKAGMCIASFASIVIMAATVQFFLARFGMDGVTFTIALAYLANSAIAVAFICAKAKAATKRSLNKHR